MTPVLSDTHRTRLDCVSMIGRTYLEHGAPVVVLARWAGEGADT